VTERADVVLPVAPAVEKSGTFLDWEGRPRTFREALRGTPSMPDVRVLHALATAMGVDLGLNDVDAAHGELQEVGLWDGDRPAFEPVSVGQPTRLADGEVVLATWPQLLDAGRLQDDEPFLAGTARTAVARVSAATAAGIGVADGDAVTVSTDRGAVTVPVLVSDIPDAVVWLPTNAPGAPVRAELAAVPGSVVRLAAASTAVDPEVTG
jgi:NADH-quinone oxidoreductase subunit G